MEFRNLTPFDALAYTSLDTQDREYHTVAMSVGYAIKPRPIERGKTRTEYYDAHVLDQTPLPLCLADEHHGDPASTSLKRESDLAPYKPKCDVVVIGKAYPEQPSANFEAKLHLQHGQNTLIDKTLRCLGPREFVRGGGLGGWFREGVNPTHAYTASEPVATSSVDLRYELAYGGTCLVPNPAYAKAFQRALDNTSTKPNTPVTEPELLMNEVCYRNPVGAGWMAQGYFDALNKTPQGLPPTLRAPQVMLAGKQLMRLVQTKQGGANLSAQQMAQYDYEYAVAGFGALNKAWAPRLALAGTYDDAWLSQRHPYLPKDFDFAYWNGAPVDQQIARASTKTISQADTYKFRLQNLTKGGGVIQFELPKHRPFVMLSMHAGPLLPHPMFLDTIEIDTSVDGLDYPIMRLVWRTMIAKVDFKHIKSSELRFEVDAQAPLIKWAKPDATKVMQGAKHG
jgi:hypothetical protein